MYNWRPRVTIISFPVGRAFASPLSNLANVCSAFCGRVSVIAGCVEDVSIDSEKAQISLIRHNPGSAFTGAVKYFLTQLRMSLLMVRQSRDTDMFLFFGQGPPVLNVLAAKLTRRPIAWMLPSSLAKTSRLQRHSLSLLLARFQPACYGLSDRIVVYSDRLVGEWGLDQYKDKISIAHEHYIDTGKFRMVKQLSDRKEVIGYVGRFSQEKGVMNFLQAVKNILEEKPGMQVLMIGCGPLSDRVDEFILKNGLGGNVSVKGWVAHDELPGYFNEMRLLVLPSYTEGLPNVMIEAMACGTPVLTTAVGAVPDIVTDDIDGFIMPDNRPETIAKNILRSLDEPRLGKIADSGRRFINENYIYEVSVKKFKQAMEMVVKRSSPA